MTPGKKNLITDIAGIQVGHAADVNLRSGVSVIVPDTPAVIGVSSLGGGPGTRETDALKPETLVSEAHAVVLAGGSVFGLDAASGVTAAMGLKGAVFRPVRLSLHRLCRQRFYSMSPMAAIRIGATPRLTGNWGAMLTVR